MFSLTDRVALVTGGSRGIGRAICVALAKSGANVFLSYSSNPAAAEETKQLCEQAGGKASVLGFDVGKSEAVEQAFETIKASAGKIDILVNNAGITSDGLLIRLKDEDWDRTIATNLSGSFYTARAAAKLMMKARYGRIINISSIVGEMGNAGQAAYVASKAGVIGLTKSLAKELAARNITANAITPGFIDTDMTAKLSPEVREAMLKEIPLARLGSGDDIASLVVFLASDAASYITGQVIGVNGGMYM